MTREERSLLLFFETRQVDYAGKVHTDHMNDDDMEIASKWTVAGFIRFGRVVAADCNPSGTHWCHLSDEAWTLAAEERKARGIRTWLKKPYQTTEEKRGGMS